MIFTGGRKQEVLGESASILPAKNESIELDTAACITGGLGSVKTWMPLRTWLRQDASMMDANENTHLVDIAAFITVASNRESLWIPLSEKLRSHAKAVRKAAPLRGVLGSTARKDCAVSTTTGIGAVSRWILDTVRSMAPYARSRGVLSRNGLSVIARCTIPVIPRVSPCTPGRFRSEHGTKWLSVPVGKWIEDTFRSRLGCGGNLNIGRLCPNISADHFARMSKSTTSTETVAITESRISNSGLHLIQEAREYLTNWTGHWNSFASMPQIV